MAWVVYGRPPLVPPGTSYLQGSGNFPSLSLLMSRSLRMMQFPAEKTSGVGYTSATGLVAPEVAGYRFEVWAKGTAPHSQVCVFFFENLGPDLL